MKILNRIKKVAVAGTVIPKPMSSQGYVVVGWGISRGEEALVYRIPTKTGAGKASTKRVPSSVFEAADAVLAATGEITHSWFATAFPQVHADGACNFTTLGGVFELLGEVVYAEPGRYRRPAALKNESAVG